MAAGSRQAALEAEGLVKRYPDAGALRTVLDRVSLRLEPGETVAVTGPSGSGKSTLLHLLAGLETPDGGTVRLLGQDLAGLGEAARSRLRRRHVGFVHQFFHLLPTLTVEENVRLPLELDGVDAGRARRRARALLAAVGLAARAGDFPEQLSGGEQQRVAIARALAPHPAVVLADEPTGNLDPAAAAGVLDLLEAAVREHGAALVLVTHSAEAAARAGRVLALRGGRLVEAP
ncbi:ABC transporter ATP-binding protein [Inmirania thermothiophila]|uniref:Putative ABC transport system ATP-binding protein n=1 Tax=Inmirania thermothiophila TaxID=1750597 RepID=A0A3N1Y5Q8_9GAMM|nr:ABC transporter ATP-binding protein [Inmirania thermothiophila]ROR34145.1 putative ABC transport system ATP-binding protein [Inmirania thermothiophila]